MQYGAVGWAVLVGAALSVQVGLNAILRARFGHAGWAATANFSIGLLALLAFTFAVRAPVPTGAQLAGVPWWAWIGGALGALYVASSTVLGPLLGVTLMTGLIVAGQVGAALLLDHYGALGFPVQPVSAGRVIGAALIVAGVVLVARG